MDTVDKATRSRIMSSIKSVSRLEHEAKPMLSRMGFRFLRHQPKGVVGRPDFANKSRKVAVFVHGCFWHMHGHIRLPKTNRRFWRDKLIGNVARHEHNRRLLTDDGWTVVEVWECEIRGRR